MYKSLKRIVLLLALVCVTLGLSAFALACNPEPEDNGPEISAEYQALYEQYKEAAGENAKTLQDWYDALSADIEEIGDIGDITDMDVLEIENVKYVALTYENGRLFLEELLNGESFREYSVFTLSPNNAADESTITGIYLDVNRKGANGALEKVRSVRTGADGKVNVYLEVGQATYVITVGEQSAEAYGFALGYEPEFSGSQETKTVAFSVQAAAQKVTYAAKVVYRAENYAGTKDVKLSLRYVESDAASSKVVGEGKTDDDGKLSISFYAHEDSKYEFVLDETSLTPEKYEPVAGPIEVDPEAEETVFTLIRRKNYSDQEILEPSGTPKEDLQDPDDQEPIALPLPTEGELSALFQLNPTDHIYTYTNSQDKDNNNKQVYVAMDFFLERVHAEKTIKQLLEEGGYFTFEECIDEDQNTWALHDYSKILNAYMEHTTKSGLYPLNEDLYKFIVSAAENGRFAEKTTDGKYDMFMPLVVYSGTKLIVGKEYTTTVRASSGTNHWSSYMTPGRTAIPIMSNVEEGWYKLKVNSDKFQDTSSANNYGLYARMGGFTWEKNGIFEFGRNFTLNMTSSAGTTSDVDFEGIIYIGAGAKEIHLLCGAYAPAATYNLKLNLSKITAEDATYSALAGKKQEILSPDKGEYEVLVYPESMLEQHTNASNSNEKKYLANFTNISTFGYSFDLNKLFRNYTITPTVGDIQGLKLHKYTLTDTISNGTGKVSFAYEKKDYAAGTANYQYATGTSTSNPTFIGVMFTHSGEDVKTMKINLGVKSTKYTITYSAGDGVGEDYTEAPATHDKFYNRYSYYTPGDRYTVLDYTHTNLNYSKEGSIFVGWSYEDAKGETKTVKPGVISIDSDINHDIVFTAVWRDITVGGPDEELTVDSPLVVDIDSGTYTNIEINLSDALEANKAYMLTISMVKPNNWTWNLTYGDYTIYLRDNEDSQSSTNTFVTFFKKVGEADKFAIDISQNDVNFKATFTLTEYTPTTLKADGEEVFVPYYSSSLTNGTEFDEAKINTLSVALDASMGAGTYYIIYSQTGPGTSTILWVRGDLASDTANNNYGASYSNSYVTVKDGVKNIRFEGNGNKFFGVAKVKFERVYSVTYECTAEDQAKGLSKNPAKDESYYLKGTQVTLKGGSNTNAYTFQYWTMKGDSTNKKYYKDDKFEIQEDTTFIAVYRELNEKLVTVNFNSNSDATKTYEGSQKLAIDPVTYTSCQIKFTNIYASTYTSNGLNMILDLGSSAFDKEIPMTLSQTVSVVFAHSDALSSDGHNIYTGFYKPSSGSPTGLTLTVDLAAWEAAGNEALDDITVKASFMNKSSNHSLAQFVKKDDGKLWANGGVRSSNYANMLFEYALPDTLMGGHTYTVHVKFNIADPQASIIGLVFHNGTDGSKTSAKTMTYNAGDKDFTYSGWDTANSRSFNLEVDNTKVKYWYTCDVWLEQTDKAENVLSLEKEVAAVKVTKDASATVYLDDSIAAVANSGSAETRYVLTLTGATDKIKLAYRKDISSPTTITFGPDTKYTAKRITFGSCVLTLSTEAETEQTVTLKLTKFDSEKATELTEGAESAVSLGADKAVVDLTFKSSLNGYYTVKLTKSDGGALDAATVIKLKYYSLIDNYETKEYTFNQANNFADFAQLIKNDTSYVELWSESGAVDVKITVKQISTLNGVGSGSRGLIQTLKQVNDSAEVLILTANGKIQYNTEYHVTVEFISMAIECQLEITCGQKTITLDCTTSSKVSKTTDKITFTEDCKTFKITYKSGTAPTLFYIYLNTAAA